MILYVDFVFHITSMSKNSFSILFHFPMRLTSRYNLRPPNYEDLPSHFSNARVNKGEETMRLFCFSVLAATKRGDNLSIQAFQS